MNNSILSSWNEGPAKKAITDFVSRVTTFGSSDYRLPEDRVAVFDNDGTLWCEKPLPIQANFLLGKLGEMVKQDISLRTKQPWKAIVEKDHAWLAGAIEKHYKDDDTDLKVMSAGLLRAFSDFSIKEYEQEARSFLESGKNSKLNRPYLECIYEPMIELMRFLNANKFTIYIASGGGRDFVRTVSERIYEIPRERVIGSSVTLTYKEDANDIFHQPSLDIFDDGPAKPVQIWNRIGRRPILAVGNSNGDIQMLHFTGHSPTSLSLLINHDDADREFDYTAGAEKALAEAERNDWHIISIKKDWNTVFAEKLQEIKNAA